MIPKQTKDFADMIHATRTLIAKVNEVIGRMDEIENTLDEMVKHPTLSTPPSGAIETMESLDRGMEIAATAGILEKT